MIYKILKLVDTIESNLDYDVEANSHSYCIKYENNAISLYIVNSYSFYDECNEAIHKDNIEKVDVFDCSIEEYCQFLIRFYEAKLELEKYDYSQYENGYLLNKISIYQIIK